MLLCLRNLESRLPQRLGFRRGERRDSSGIGCDFQCGYRRKHFAPVAKPDADVLQILIG
jgi:hypothetical protein